MQVGSVIAKFKSDLSGFKKGIAEAQGGVRNFASKAKVGLTKVRNASLIATGAIVAVGTASLKLGAVAGKYESIKDAFGSMTKDMGIGVEDFEKKVGEASRGTLDRLTILQGGTRALSLMGKEAFSDFGNQFANMAALSKKAARATGQDVTFMFDSLITGMSRESKMILDNLGITVDLTQAKKDYAEELGKSTDDLTIAEEKTAVLNHTLGKLETIYGDVAVSSGGFAGGMSALKTTITNAQIEIGTALLPVLNDLVRTLTPIIAEYVPKLVSLIQRAVEWFKNLDPKMQKIIIAFIALAPVIAIVTGLILALVPIITALLSPIGLVILAIVALATAWATNWGGIRDKTQAAINFVKNLLSSAGNFIKSWGSRIYSSLVSPFEKAWNKIKDFVNKINDKLDFTKRHSPSVVDIINKGVRGVNSALSGLDFNLGDISTPIVAGAGVGKGGNIVNVNMSGANITSPEVAEEYAEIIGNKIVRRLSRTARTM